MSANLWQLKTGVSAVVCCFDKTMHQAQRQRLTELGFGVGAQVHCVLRTRFGAPRLYRGAGAVFSLERRIAQQVQLVDDGDKS